MVIETGTHKIFRFHNNRNYYEIRLNKEGLFQEALKGDANNLTSTKNEMQVLSLMKKKEPKLFLQLKKALNKADPLFSKIKEIE